MAQPTKMIGVTFRGNDKIKKWNAVSNYYARNNSFMSRPEILRFLVEQEYDRLKEQGLVSYN